MSEQTSEERNIPGADPGEVGHATTPAGVSDQSAGNLTVEDDPQGTHDPADLAGTGEQAEGGVE